MSSEWFSVSREGLRQLQAGKPKTFIINELCQNALDENTSICKLSVTRYGKPSDKLIEVSVEDDSPEGFRDISHAYTLFAETYKRRDPTKRGRFNLGEKQVLSVCERAIISTTKGIIIFDDKGRSEDDTKRPSGSKITVHLKSENPVKDIKELVDHAKTLIIPPSIKFYINNTYQPHRSIEKTFEASLTTEILDEKGEMLVRTRKTAVNLIHSGSNKSTLYEMGIPVTDIDTPWHIDVQQKIPLAVDRETVKLSYLQDLYAHTLNATYRDLPKDKASEAWVRIAMKDKEIITKEACESVMTKRYGDKYCIANPLDKASMDEALSKGYNVIYGNELSSEEWDTVKTNIEVPSSTKLFGDVNLTKATPVSVTPEMQKVETLAKRIADRILGFSINVVFVNNSSANILACYGDRTLTFNVGRLGVSFFDTPCSTKTLDLIVHELGHENGWHVEYAYHQLLTKLGSELIILALNEPSFFEVN